MEWAVPIREYDSRVAEQNEDKYEATNLRNVHELYFYLISLYN